MFVGLLAVTSIGLGLKLLGSLGAGTTDIAELLAKTGVGEVTLTEALWELESNGFIGFDGRTVAATGLTRPLLAAHLLRSGVSLQELSRMLSWKEFEELTTEALTACGYQAIRTFRMRKPTREIDVIGVHSGFAIAFDCKHWERMSESALEAAAARQVERCRQYLSTLAARVSDVSEVMPAILVLFEPSFSSVDGIAVVPVDKAFSFILSARGLAKTLVTVRR